MNRALALAAALWGATAAALPGEADLETAALKTAQALGGVLRSCPPSFSQIGSAQKRCVGVGEDVEAARVKLSAAMTPELYGVWRSRDGQRSVYNWLQTAGGYVYLRLQPDPDGRAQTLAYLDLPPVPAPSETTPTAPNVTQIGEVILTPAVASAQPAAASSPETPSATPALPSETSASSTTPVAPPASATVATTSPAASSALDRPFVRPLSLNNQRLHGPDVLAVQNRLIALMRPVRTGQGDGWYGPVTATTVRVFQQASGLPATGVVDQVTWEHLFSDSAVAFDAPIVP